MTKKLIYGLLIFSLLQMAELPVPGQSNSDLVLHYLKATGNRYTLKAQLTYSGNDESHALPGAEIALINGSDNRQLLGKAITDDKGTALLEINGDPRLKSGDDGVLMLIAEFNGNDTISASAAEVNVKDIRMEMVLSEIDSIRNVTVKAITYGEEEEIPVIGETVKVYVPRMFSMLLIGELTLDNTGSASIEFPSDLPGDKDGNIVIVARIEDNSTYGNAEVRQTTMWGLPTDYSVPVTHRALWTTIAPRWMIYSLTILLSGVWGHYLFAIISLIRIKREARRRARMEYRA